MRMIDFYPAKGSFSPGERILFLVELETPSSESARVQIFIRHFSEQVAVLESIAYLVTGKQTIQIEWDPLTQPAGYSARVEILSIGGTHISTATTAFDVLSNWTDFPRYGFLTDFSAARQDPESVLKNLTRFHINGLQFYDWQYRHDQPLAQTDEYIDPLGREISLGTVKKLVEVAHRYGMAAMPYLAIYGASAEFWRAHPDWALYDEAGNPIAFGENFLGLMDPSPGCLWSHHLLEECNRALEHIAFDGLHIDQYGDPKRAWDSHGNSVDLPMSFVDFIQSASDQHPSKTILFNAVGNWPIEALAKSAVDFLYIEVWPPAVEYLHLAEIVLMAVQHSHGKAVVVALYLPARHPANNLLADAVILACGGTRIELGEDGHLLSDPYFPKHEEISPEVSIQLRRFSNFMVRNGEWLRPYNLSPTDREKWSQSMFNPEFISINDSIWTVVRSYPKAMVIQLVNLTGLYRHQHWNEVHSTPAACKDVILRLQSPVRPAQILWDCPEQTSGPQILESEYSDGTLKVRIPKINFIGLVVIHE